MNAESDIDPSYELITEKKCQEAKLNLVKNQKLRFYKCHRCFATTKIVGHYPYCTECNWDSLTDVYLNHFLE